MNMERVKYWLGEGAQPTDRVSRMLEAAGELPKKDRNNPKKGTPGKAAQARADEKAEKAKAAEEAARRMQAEEKQEVKQLRKKMSFKAHPFAPKVPPPALKSTKPLTCPITPHFATDKRRRHKDAGNENAM